MTFLGSVYDTKVKRYKTLKQTGKKTLKNQNCQDSKPLYGLKFKLDKTLTFKDIIMQAEFKSVYYRIKSKLKFQSLIEESK